MKKKFKVKVSDVTTIATTHWVWVEADSKKEARIVAENLDEYDSGGTESESEESYRKILQQAVEVE